MKYFKNITLWENKRRTKLLKRFYDLMLKYFDNVRYSFGETIENEEAAKVRIEINKDLDEIYLIMIAAGIDPSIIYSPPPASGVFYRQRVSLLHNFHNLRHYNIQPNGLMDFIVRSASIYSKDFTKARLRTFNPIYWIGCILDYIADLPFVLVGKLGFNRTKAEASLIGRILKMIFKTVIFLSALVVLLEHLGYLEMCRDFIRKVLNLS